MAASPTLAAGDLTPNAFTDLCGTLTWPDEALLQAFTVAEARFDFYQDDAAFLHQTDQGRIFAPAAELRWRRMGDLMRVVYLGAAPAPAGLVPHPAALEGLTPARRTLLLWGVRTDQEPEWLEQQVPHRFTYPLSTAARSRSRVGLVVEDWCDAAGIPRFSRYHHLSEEKGESHHAAE